MLEVGNGGRKPVAAFVIHYHTTEGRQNFFLRVLTSDGLVLQSQRTKDAATGVESATALRVLTRFAPKALEQIKKDLTARGWQEREFVIRENGWIDVKF